MRIFKQLAILSTVAALAAAVVSCHRDDAELTPSGAGAGRIEVRIAAPATRGFGASTRAEAELPANPTVTVDGGAAAQMPQTRLSFEEDGVTMRWTKGDRIALWGYSGANAAFENEIFTLWYPREDPSQGLFTGKVNAMTTGTYDYYAACPAPEAAAGTQASYTIPEVQDGRWNSDLDIMLAKTSGAELREEILNDVTLRFAHKVHALKVTIPAGRNLLGRPIEKLRIEFGRPVAGRLTWDLANPDAEPLKEQTATGITLAFDTPVDEGDTFWVYLAPVDLTGGEVRFVATDGEEFSWPLSTWSFRDCAAGRITPVRLTVDELRPQHRYTVTVDPTHLGEPVTQIDSLMMPAGYEFPSLALRSISDPIAVNTADGSCTVGFFEDQPNPFTAEGGVSMSVSSENTEGVYGKRCEVNAATADGCTVMAPYLFFEDFSEVSGNDTHADKDGTAAFSLAEVGLPGWTGSRWKTEARTSLEIRTHIASADVGTGKYARIDTPALPIRSGKTVNITVHYDIGATVDFGSSTNKNKIHADCIFGSSTEPGLVAGGANGNRNYPSNKVDEYTLPHDGTPTYRPTVKDTPVSGVTEQTRLSWFGYYHRDSGSFIFVTGATFYYYIGNIRVTIVP